MMHTPGIRILHRLKTVFLLLAILSASFTAFSQQKMIELKADRNEIMIGEQVTLLIEVQAPVNATIQWPAFRDTLSSKLEIVGQSPVDTIYPDNNVTVQVQTMALAVTSFDSGYHVVPPITVLAAGDSLKTNPLLITVKMVPAGEKEELRDIKEPLDISFSMLEWLMENWKWLLTATLVIMIVLAYFMFFHNKKVKVQEEKPVVPPKTAHELALEKLEQINQKKLWQNDQLKQYHSELSEVLREYIENRYGINAMEQTSDEIFANLKYIEMPEASRNQLRQVLLLSDMVKFAKEKPTSSENELSMSNAVAFVESTKMLKEKEEITSDNDQTSTKGA